MSASKRDELVRKALDVFYEHGFHATGMDRLVAETGISKTSMYKHFRTKEDLIVAVLRLRDEEFRNWLTRRMEALAGSPEDRLLALYDALDEWFTDRRFQSCMFIKASSEYQEAGHPIHAQCVEHNRLMLSALTNLAEKAGFTEPEKLAMQLFLLTEGSIVAAHLFGPDHIASSARQAATDILARARR